MPIQERSQGNISKSIESFKRAVERQVAIPESEWDYVAPLLKERCFDKDDYLVRAGEVAGSFFFIVQGLARFFYLTEDGKEFNKHFAMENRYAGSFHSFVLNEPCGFSIQAMEKTRTLVLPYQLLSELYERHACWERMGRTNAERLALIKEAREKELLLDSLEVRYRRFLQEFPGLVERVSQYHIASYLGVTPVALSRVRRKINLG